MNTLRRAVIVALLPALLSVMPVAAQGTPETGGTRPQEISFQDIFPLALSPDGTKLAGFPQSANVAAPAVYASRLCVYEMPSLAEQTCGDLSALGEDMPLGSIAWSPDSSRIVVVGAAFLINSDTDLLVMDVATGEVVNVTDDGYSGVLPIHPDVEPAAEPVSVDIVPTWTPDGRSLTFSRSPIAGKESQGTQIAQLDLTTGQVETLVEVSPDLPGTVYLPMTWTPDGGRLYYTVNMVDADDPANGLWVYDAASGDTQHVLDRDPQRGVPLVTQIAPTGGVALIVYPQLAARGGGADLYALADLETGEVIPIQPDRAASDETVAVATLSPDGRQVLYGLRGTDDTARLMLRDVPTGEAQVVAADLPAPWIPFVGLKNVLFWGANGTVLMVAQDARGIVLQLDAASAELATPRATPVTP